MTLTTALGLMGRVKLGHPVPLSYLSVDENNRASQAAHVYSPAALWSQNRPVNGGSVAEQRQTAYCSGLKRSRHSASVFSKLAMSALPRTTCLEAQVSRGWRAPA